MYMCVYKHIRNYIIYSIYIYIHIYVIYIIYFNEKVFNTFSNTIIMLTPCSVTITTAFSLHTYPFLTLKCLK